MPTTKIKPVTKMFTRNVNGKDYELEVPQCQTVGNGEKKDDIIGCPCNHGTWCNADTVPREFSMTDLYDLKTIGYPSWCPLADKEDEEEKEN